MTAINQNRPPSGTTEQARQQASRVGHQTAQAGGQLGHAAAEQGRQVAAQARQQAHYLSGEATSQLREQARSQKHRAAEGLRSMGRDLGSMADQGDSGMAGEAVRRVGDVAQRAAGWLDEREPADVLHDVRSYARRHPGMFLAGAAVAGLLFGRLTRNMSSSGDGYHPEAGRGQTGQPMRGQMGQTPTGPQPYERTVEAPYSADVPYTRAGRAQNMPPAERHDPGVPGGVAP
ncbi:hypothetical protein AB0J20_12070 [Micromonospora costi]|uniref:hypothetical protein n=1 Tax=Micromonospora costi TaxID=1530042 RepID=UPI0033EF5722